MGKTSKGGASNQLFKDKARNRVDDLQGMLKDLQFAMKESRTGDIAVIEERMNQTLREWKAELSEPSPASSQNDGSLGSLSSDLFRFLVEDDATSGLSHTIHPNREPETNTQSIQVGDNWDFLELQDYYTNQAPSEQDFHRTDQFKGFGQHTLVNNTELPAQLNYHQYNGPHHIEHNLHSDSDGTLQYGESVGNQVSSSMSNVDPPSAFLGPKCALWDCARLAKGLQGCQDYCDKFHADLAKIEGPPGSAPVMRCGGIDINDDVLFAALIAKTQGKDVGVPECEGAATTKSPWKASELFNFVLEGETVREWVFFDKPRRAFESGNRKQRSLPDYNGRGWHESRKKTVEEFGGLKRSYYMDPQPLQNSELHLFVYEIKNNDVCALYRLELKLDDGKKSTKAKVSDNSPADLQKQNTPAEDSQSFTIGKKHLPNGDECIRGTPSQNTPTNKSCFSRDYSAYQTLQEHGSQGLDCYKSSPRGVQHPSMNNLEVMNQLDYQFDFHQDFNNNSFLGYTGSGQCEEDNTHCTLGIQSSICHPFPFVRQKCALWDCSRPAQGSDYCSMSHGTSALNEGPLSTTPVVRPRGISLKEGALFASLSAKTQGKEVGIPECEGAATMKSPWNAPELFDIYFFEGETIREWLLFDKPRKAFESGNRKQRSLPDYSGRGWHSSGKKVWKEFGGVKKSYYMDPQPLEHAKWHLYEYELDNCDALILFRFELKFADGKKSPKGKVAMEIADLQKQMVRLNAKFPADNELSVKSEKTANFKHSPEDVYSTLNQMPPANDRSCYGVSSHKAYQVENQFVEQENLPSHEFSHSR